MVVDEEPPYPAVPLIHERLHDEEARSRPSLMGFLRAILGRPRNERPFVLIPVGYPAADCRVSVLRRKGIGEVMIRM